VNLSLQTPCLSIHAKRHETSAWNLNVMTFFVIRKWHFKLRMARETISLIYLTLILMSSNLFMLKEVFGYMLWSKVLRVGQKNNSYIWVIQENSIEISLQTNLPYILLLLVYACYYAPYSKWPCIVYEVNMWYPCCMMLFVLDPSSLFFASHDLTLTLCSKNGKICK